MYQKFRTNRGKYKIIKFLHILFVFLINFINIYSATSLKFFKWVFSRFFCYFFSQIYRITIRIHNLLRGLKLLIDKSHIDPSQKSSEFKEAPLVIIKYSSFINNIFNQIYQIIYYLLFYC